MAINLQKLDSAFQAPTLDQKQEQKAYRKWQAVFYSLRTLMWEASKGKVFRDAIEDGTIEATTKANKLPDGTWSRAEFEEDDIKELYSNAWAIFTEQFDEAFIKAEIGELADFSESRFGQNMEQLLKMNDERSADKFNR